MGGVEAEIDADVGGGGGRDIFPPFDGAGGRFCQDGITAGHLYEVHSAVRIDDDVQANDASDGSALEVRGILGFNLGKHFSGDDGLVGLLRVQPGGDPRG